MLGSTASCASARPSTDIAIAATSPVTKSFAALPTGTADGTKARNVVFIDTLSVFISFGYSYSPRAPSTSSVANSRAIPCYMSRSTAAFPRGLDLRFWGVVNQVNEVNLLPNPFLAKGFCLESFEKKVHIEGGDSLRYL